MSEEEVDSKSALRALIEKTVNEGSANEVELEYKTEQVSLYYTCCYLLTRVPFRACLDYYYYHISFS